MKYTPKGRQIAVVKIVEQMSSILAIPTASQEVSDTHGRVVAVSDFVKEFYPEVTIGTTAIFSEYAGTTYRLGLEDVTFMGIDSILAVSD